MEKCLDPFLTKLCDEVTIQEERKGFFNCLVGHIKANTSLFEWGEEQLSNRFYGEDFLKKLVSNPAIFNTVYETFCVSEVYRKKCNETAEKLLKEAEVCWQENKYDKCKHQCSAAILRADTKEEWGKNLTQRALLLRSQTLIKSEKYDLAKKDVNKAIRLGQLDGYLKNNLNKSLQDLKNIKNTNTFEKSAETNSYPTSLGISSFVDLTETEEMGRFYTASKDINIGENLIIEKPYSSYLVQNCFGTHCHHCFHRLEAPVGCPDCSTVAFCSEICLEEATSSYHKYECKYIELFIGSGMAILCFVALRVVTQVGLKESLSLHKKYVSKTDEWMDIKSAAKFDHESFFKLCTHEENRCPQDYVRRVLMTFFLLRCLKKTFFENESLNENISVSSEELKIWSLLLRTLQLLQFNAHQIMDKTNTKEKAYGLFPKTSMMNHQCSPNVSRIFYGKYMIIKALQPICQGQMIGDSYGPQWGRSLKGGSGQKREERRRILSSRYWFLCKCVTCCQNWPNPPPEIPFLRCPDKLCHGNTSKENYKCSACNKSIIEEDVKTILSELKTSIENIKNAFKMENNQMKISTIIKHLNEYWKHTRIPCPVVIKAEDVLRLSYSKVLAVQNMTLQ